MRTCVYWVVKVIEDSTDKYIGLESLVLDIKDAILFNTHNQAVFFATAFNGIVGEITIGMEEEKS